MHFFQVIDKWFHWGTGSLFFLGIAIIVVAAVVPWDPYAKRQHLLVVFTLLALYLLSEIVALATARSPFVHLLFLMIGGVSLSIAVGRLIRMGISRLQFR